MSPHYTFPRRRALLLISTGLITALGAQALGPAINLAGRADAVLPADRREPVFEVLDLIMNRVDPAFPQLLAELPDPFVYDSRGRFRVARVEEVPEVEPEPEPVRVEVPDETVLERIAPVFGARITGTLQRGDNVFLQLRGGDIVREGNVIPVTLPALRAEPYMIQIGPITSRELILILNQARLAVPIPGVSGGGARLAPNPSGPSADISDPSQTNNQP